MLDRKKTFSDNGIILESDWRDVGQQQRAGTKSKHQLITHPIPPDPPPPPNLIINQAVKARVGRVEGAKAKKCQYILSTDANTCP